MRPRMEIFNKPLVRKRLQERDGPGCWLCKMSHFPSLTIHHVVFLSENGSNELRNFIMLCKSCHKDRAHGPQEKGWQRIFLAYLVMRHEVEEFGSEKVETIQTTAWIRFKNLFKAKARQ